MMNKHFAIAITICCLGVALAAQTPPPPPLPPLAPAAPALAPLPPMGSFAFNFAQDAARPNQARVAEMKAMAADRYQEGLDAINDARWQSALQYFQSAAYYKAANADASLYWEAYAASKLGQMDQAMAALKQFQTDYPKSDWSQDVAALELQLKQMQGQPVTPASQSNDDLKLLAINGIMQSNPAQATPLLEKVVEGNSSGAVKSRALFVLAQSHSPAAVAVLVKVAQSPADPALGMQAVRYLGMDGGDSGRAALAQVYTSSPSPDVKGAIIRAFGLSRDMDHLLPLAEHEQNPVLRQEAIRYLGISDAPQAQQALVSMYTGASDRADSEAIIRALYIHRSDAALVGLARKETDPQLKQDIVRMLSTMHTPAATAYLMELLNQ